jgi:DNA polymerase III alpha subunit
VSLHSHCRGSMNDGFGRPIEHINYVIENGGTGWCITDHGNMNAMAEAVISVNDLKSKGIEFKLINGCEMYLHPDLDAWRAERAQYEEQKKNTKKSGKKKSQDDDDPTPIVEDEEHETSSVIENEDKSKRSRSLNPLNRRHHLVVLPKNRKGLSDLFNLVSTSFKEENFYKYPRIDFKTLKKFKGDLIVSTACVSGILSYDVLSEFPNVPWDDLTHQLLDEQSFQRVLNRVENSLDRLVDAVGKENVFLELQFNKMGAQHLVNRILIECSKKNGIPLVTTCDSHYPRPELWRAREIYKKLAWMKYETIGPEDLPKSIEDLKCELYPKNASQMWDEYKRTTCGMEFYDDQMVCDAIERSHDIAYEMIGDVSPDTSVKLPRSVVPEGKTETQALFDFCKVSLVEKGLHTKPEYIERLKKELELLKTKKFERYFLLMNEVMSVARKSQIIGCGRGSSVGSLINYLLGITQIDPLRYGVIFERFISLSREGLPDIDCLSALHMIKLSNGDYKLLAHVSVGDEVIDIDGIPRKILGVDHRRSNTKDVILEILIDQEGTLGTLVCNHKHRFFDKNRSIVFSSDLKPGDELHCLDPMATTKVLRVRALLDSIELVDIVVEGTSSFQVVPFDVVDNEVHSFHQLGKSVTSHNSDFSNRDALFEDLEERFGRGNVLYISNYNTFKLKSLVKDVSKFYGIPFDEVNEVTKVVEGQVKSATVKQGDDKNLFELKFEDAMEHSPPFKEFMEKYPDVAEVVQLLNKQDKSCFTNSVKILTSNGYKRPTEVDPTIDALAFLDSNERLRFNDKFRFIEQGKRNYHVIELENGKKLELTGDHEVMTQRGYVRVDQLLDDDEIEVVE